MKKNNTFTLKKLVLALALAGYTMSSAYAVLTQPTGTIQGTAPILSAVSNNAQHAVDFSGTYAVAGSLSSGDTIVMEYGYADSDGDGDDSSDNTRVTWAYTPAGGGADVAIASTGVNATSGTPGTSTIILPAGAVGATVIKATIQEYSASGDPIFGQTITIADTSLTTAPGGGGGGGTGVTPPGPVLPGSNVTPGIYLSTDAAFANNLIGTATNLNVGDTYVFKLWDSAAVGTTDLTSTVPNYNWRLVGQSATDSVTAPGTGFITSVTGGNFTIPVNTAADGTPLTGSADGAQGFNLAVAY
ncbi:SinI family autotransporter-associated protein [Yersinia hibernica]|uniref:Ornithine carbamoyltransferase n=1 Tax=Yersinia enterocolitica LC20 TaxID=1443113 RepID=A0A7U4K1N8_YEREN|nr:SinI family autotransporter-associated protein [Yersinia hibernica]AHM74484.1 ornithine carbamoyltransferase [Yersinia hibernica]